MGDQRKREQAREAILAELQKDIQDPQALTAERLANTVENTLMLAERLGYVSYDPPPTPLVAKLCAAELRAMADQLDAYQMLRRAGARLSLHPSRHNPGDGIITVNGRRLAYLEWYQDQFVSVIMDGPRDRHAGLSYWQKEDRPNRYVAAVADADEDDAGMDF